MEPPKPADAGTGPDHLSHLYKMSTTSAGGQEYVAINSAAIAALILGFASVLGMATPVLLVIPLGSIICGIIALIQIRGSSGTQTGRALAWGGIGLATLIGGIKVGVVSHYWLQDHADMQIIVPMVDRLSDDLHTRRYDEAYEDLFSSTFRARVDRQTFANTFEQFKNNPNIGALQKIEWNGQRIDFGEVGTSGIKVGNMLVIMRFPSPDVTMRPLVTFATRDGVWKIDNIEMLFPDKAKATIQ
jgi:hypothetical protein